MKIKDVAIEYGFDFDDFETFIFKEKGIELNGFLSNNIPDSDVPKAVELYKEHLVRLDELKRAEEAEKAEALRIQNLADSMILSTCSSVDGYVAVEQCGLVFGECLFKASLSNVISAAFDNLTDAFSFKEKEMSGTTALLERAREYSLNKLTCAAAKRGANAVIGIDSESSTSGEVTHITVYGTAVKLEKIATP